MEQVFISYTEKDSQFAHILADEFARWGIVPSIDNRLEKGRNWPPSIQGSIKACPVFILVMSPEASKSAWVQKEIEYARSLRKPIFPILLRGGTWGNFPSNQYLDLRNKQIPEREFFLKVQGAIQKETPSSASVPPQRPGIRPIIIETKAAPPQRQPAPERRSVAPHQRVSETLAALAKRSGRSKLGEYIIECSMGFFGDVTLIIRLADDQVRLSGGQAIHPSNKAKVLGNSQPVTFNYEQSSYQYRAGYKMTVYSSMKYMDAAIEMIKLYEASGLNPADLLLEPTPLP